MFTSAKSGRDRVNRLTRRTLHFPTSAETPTAKSSNDDDGVYVSLDQLIKIKNQLAALKQTSSHLLHNGQPGANLSTLKGQGLEFEDIRPYMPGDDLRHVDWRVIARTGIPYTRRYSEDRERASLIAVDQRANMFFGSGAEFKSYTASVTAAKVVWSAVANGHRLGGIIAAETIDQIRVGSSHRTGLVFLNNLVIHNNALTNRTKKYLSFENLLEYLTDNIQRGMIVTIISDFHDLNPHSEAMLAAFTSRCQIHLIRIFDPLEQEIHLHGQVGISNGTKTKQAWLNRSVLDKYREKRVMVSNSLDDITQNPAITLTNVTTGH